MILLKCNQDMGKPKDCTFYAVSLSSLCIDWLFDGCISLLDNCNAKGGWQDGNIEDCRKWVSGVLTDFSAELKLWLRERFFHFFKNK